MRILKFAHARPLDAIGRAGVFVGALMIVSSTIQIVAQYLQERLTGESLTNEARRLGFSGYFVDHPVQPCLIYVLIGSAIMVTALFLLKRRYWAVVAMRALCWLLLVCTVYSVISFVRASATHPYHQPPLVRAISTGGILLIGSLYSFLIIWALRSLSSDWMRENSEVLKT